MNLSFIFAVILTVPLPSDSLYNLLMRSEMKLAAVAMHPEDTLSPINAIHYDIHIANWEGQEITAWTHGVYELRQDVVRIPVHFRGFTIDSLRVDGSETAYFRTDSTIEITPPLHLSPGDTFELDVWYHGVPPSSSAGFDGGLKFSGPYIYVAFDLDAPRSWFPCHDVPFDKATVDQFITLPDYYTVIANGSLVSVDTLDSVVTYHWSESYPIATYLIVFAAYPNYAHVVDTAYVDGHAIPVHGWVARWDSVNRAPKLRHVADILEFFSQVYTPYPFLEEKYANVDVPLGYAMENQTNTFIDMNLNWGRNWDWVLAHELSHQWWGDCVTLATWPDVWLNEGFATYSEAINAYRTDGMQGYRDYMRSIMNRYIYSEPYPPYPIYYPDANITQLYSVVTYQKGASVLHMLRHIVGDSIFFAILRGRIERHAYGNETTAEFQQLCEEISGMDLDWFFDEWVYAPGHPVYRWNYSVEPQGDSALVTLNIYQVQSHSFGVPTYRMPIDFLFIMPDSDSILVTVVDSLDFQQFYLTLPAYPQEVVFDPDGWLLARVTFTGVEEETHEPEKPAFFISSDLVSDRIGITLNLEPGSPQAVNVRLVDPSGRIVKSLSGRFSGRTNLGMDVSDVVSGIYFLYVRSNGIPLGSKKIVITN